MKSASRQADCLSAGYGNPISAHLPPSTENGVSRQAGKKRPKRP
jgi:hypothetical protein